MCQVCCLRPLYVIYRYIYIMDLNVKLFSFF
uniref:Ribose-phosphate pyrophosphokinase 1 isoform x1 n=1 Tax=Triatoma infestans TaxID=30076 RepID=A0A161N003_TRIIF